MKNFSDSKVFLREIIATWRVITCIIVFELVGGCIGILIHHYRDTFMDFWIGGAFSAVFGFAVATAWHKSKSPKGIYEHYEILALLGFISFVLFVVSLLLLIFGLPVSRYDRNLVGVTLVW